MRNVNEDMCRVNNNTDKVEMKIKLVKETPFHCTPRRLAYTQKIQLKKILDDLLDRQVIRESDSPYASPIVLVEKKNREPRLCVDYRELNNVTARDNYPLPLIEDLLDRLRDKRYFSILDLKSGFHHVKMSEDSIKYTSFVTPMGQFEFLKMPFGLKNAPSVFQRFVNQIFKPLVNADQLFMYLDDILVATATAQEHLQVLGKVINLVKDNNLELRFDKCKFMYEEIQYLGYTVNGEGVKPNIENIRAVEQFPIPKDVKGIHSFLGLCSYFRKFIREFATIAKPLYDLLRKDAIFRFGEKERDAFERLKSCLLDAPTLAIYSPYNETELHCDASAVGFGAILLQRQADKKMHPIFYFSKRATDTESRYHSYELETLAIVYALRRFRVYLTGIKFKIVTDCQALTLTLRKKLLNPRISRWALELQDYDYTIEHRSGQKMPHVDALSRVSEVLIVEEDTFEYALAAAQYKDPHIRQIAHELGKRESQWFTLINGLVYRKHADNVRFYVPSRMEEKVIQAHHEFLCHLGAEKCYENIKRIYWFPNMKGKIVEYIADCLKCISFSPSYGKKEGVLHGIPKGDKPFDVIHIDHLGPLPITKARYRHVFLIVDGFTKFVKLYAVRSTTTREAVACLEKYFACYSRPCKIVSDRGTAFTSQEFVDFVSKYSIQHIKIATSSPQANGQVERVNRTIIPMLAKENDPETADWCRRLKKIEFALNNSVCKTTGMAPSTLLFGVRQKGEICDKIAEFIEINVNPPANTDLNSIRETAAQNIRRHQEYSQGYYDKRHRQPRQYRVGDLIMLKNVVTTPGLNKKLLPKFRGPYVVSKIIGNDRYCVKDLDNWQVSRVPYEGVSTAANMRPYAVDKNSQPARREQDSQS